jgi:hypothetical protein
LLSLDKAGEPKPSIDVVADGLLALDKPSARKRKRPQSIVRRFRAQGSRTKSTLFAEAILENDREGIMELIRSSWLITSLSPPGEKMSKQSVPAGDICVLLARYRRPEGRHGTEDCSNDRHRMQDRNDEPRL